MSTIIDRDALAKKVNKLLALASSVNEHEAALAAQRAMEMLTKYNLTRSELEQQEYVRKFYPRHHPKQAKWVCPILIKFFNVRIMQDDCAESEGLNGLGGLGADVPQYAFMGEPHNVDIALYVFPFLMRAYKNLWAEHCEVEKARVGRKPSERAADEFYMGIRDGLIVQLDAARAEVVKACGGRPGLVPVDSGLTAFYYNLYPNAVNTRLRGTTRGAEYGAGHAQGENLRIHRAVRSGGGKFGGFITCASKQQSDGLTRTPTTA